MLGAKPITANAQSVARETFKLFFILKPPILQKVEFF